MRVKCPAQEQNKMSLARAQTWTAQSGHEYTNHGQFAMVVDFESK